jgi:anti-anti-sigma factor
MATAKPTLLESSEHGPWRGQDDHVTAQGSHTDVDAGTALTAATAADLRAAVADAMGQGRTIDLHLDAVVSYDAAGLGLLVGLRRRIDAAGGHLVCVNPSPHVYSGIRRLGLHRVLDIRLDLPDHPTAVEKRGHSSP